MGYRLSSVCSACGKEGNPCPDCPMKNAVRSIVSDIMGVRQYEQAGALLEVINRLCGEAVQGVCGTPWSQISSSGGVEIYNKMFELPEEHCQARGACLEVMLRNDNPQLKSHR